MGIPAKAAAFVAVIASLSFAQRADEPFFGVWKLNLDKSPSSPIMQSQVISLISEDGLFVMIEDNVTAKGTKYRVTCKLALDGNDYPMIGSTAGIELIAGTRLGPNSAVFKAKKKDGAVVGTYWMTVSNDGKMRITLFWAGAEPSGPPARIAVHDRQ
ncbi:MAG: hypothetical protein HYZ37_03615 [Candidatus Solibacter usitatus]|nr:hypothetical protein [Candidatus Solibacter usitatus]